MARLLEGQRVLITGGSAGIGLAVAEKCAAEGAKLVLASRTKKDLEAALARLSGGGHEIYPLNVGSEPEVKKCAAWAKKTLGSLHGLVNCAGVYGPIGPLHEIDMGDFTQAIQINFLGTAYMC